MLTGVEAAEASIKSFRAKKSDYGLARARQGQLNMERLRIALTTLGKQESVE